MPTSLNLIIRNKLSTEKRDLNIYHHADRSAYIISYNNAITIPLDTADNHDYLHLSVVSGPGNLEKECWLNIPSWCYFKISAIGNGDITHNSSRMWVRIPPGPPIWQLKITQPKETTHYCPEQDYIMISDEDSTPEESM